MSARPLIHRARTVAWTHEARIARPGHEGEGESNDIASSLCRINVSRTQLDLAFRPGEAVSISNDQTGITQLLEQLTAVHLTLVILEATGG